MSPVSKSMTRTSWRAGVAAASLAHVRFCTSAGVRAESKIHTSSIVPVKWVAVLRPIHSGSLPTGWFAPGRAICRTSRPLT